MTTATGERRMLVEEPTGASHPTLSPDGRWLAYVLGDASELVARSWPDLGHRTVVAGPEAHSPAWSRGGRERLYLQVPSESSDTTSAYLAVRSFDPSTGVAGDPTTIPLPANCRGMGPVRSYDVTADGQRIALILQGAEVTPLPRQVHIVLNWASTIQP